MISKSILNQAKSFLCWEKFSDLSITLIQLDHAIGFYYPPKTALHTILLFYEKNQNDFTKPLCLLFHEAGHLVQYNQYDKTGTKNQYQEHLNSRDTDQRLKFEEDAWRLGKSLFTEFCARYQIGTHLIEDYDSYQKECLNTYMSK